MVRTKRQELLDWLEDIEDLPTLLQVERIKNMKKEPFDFDREWERGYSPEEFKAEMHKRIKSYPWKK